MNAQTEAPYASETMKTQKDIGNAQTRHATLHQWRGGGSKRKRIGDSKTGESRQEEKRNRDEARAMQHGRKVGVRSDRDHGSESTGHGRVVEPM